MSSNGSVKFKGGRAPKPDKPELPPQTHGPALWSRGRESYPHLSLLAVPDHANYLREHLARDHHQPIVGGHGYPQNVETHAYVHGVTMHERQ